MDQEYRQVRWFGRVMVIGLIVVLASGCSLLKSRGESQSIDPPPVNANLAAEDGTGTTTVEDSNATITDTTIDSTATGTAGTAQITLYFKDANGYVAPISMNLPSKEQIAKQSLEYLVDGGPAQASLPAGFTALLPKGTEVKGINIVPDQKLAIVDFSEAFASYNAKDERKILEAVVWTLTGFPTIDQVQFRLEGKTMSEMPVDSTPLAEPLSRAMGINLEVAPGVNVGQATPVTLYFHNETTEQFEYFVPVTRMINRTDQRNAAVMEQLVEGPLDTNGLTATLTAVTKVSTIQQSADNQLVTVDLANNSTDSDEAISPEALEAIVLSLTESSGASMVQFTVNGEKKALSQESQNYSQPVGRPAHVNPLKL
ncbi:GerMN domain-containing protein [Paenibacillus psychroresistens]|nr:GerMN domain-containing protein [Paenibacillus psychroresistens]